MSQLHTVKTILANSLQISTRDFTADTPLLGALPELDSMAVVNIITSMEEQLGIIVADDEIDADTFATLGSLADFIAEKV